MLIVEDETITRSILARVASTIPGVSALAVGSIQEAQAALEVASPDVAIIDLHLQDGLGFEVLKALDEKGGVMMAIISSAHLSEHERELSASPGRLRCMPKPIDYGELKRTLTSVSSGGVFFHGPFAPMEYVQLAGSGRHSVKLACYDPAGTPIGGIIILEGRVWSAETPHAAGLQALRELVARPDARVRLEALSETSGPANVDRHWQIAVLDAMTPEREAIATPEPSGATDGELFGPAFHSLQSVPPGAFSPSDHPGLPLTASAAEFSELAMRAMLGADYPRAVLALERALTLEPENTSVLQQLERLYQLQRSVKE